MGFICGESRNQMHLYVNKGGINNLGTTQRITMLCDADKRLIYQDLEEYNQATVTELQVEYLCHAWNEEGRKFIVAVAVAVSPALKQIVKVIQEFEIRLIDGDSDREPVGLFAELLEQKQLTTADVLDNAFHERWNKYCRERNNNYRKLHALPLKRRPRCRWRQRESRRKLDGLSPDIVIFDECAFAGEG